MESDEDDYMSDKLLSCESDIRPGLTFNNRQKRGLELYKKEQELRAKKPKSYHEQEKETRDKGLNNAITSENKGFQLLAKMGFQPGASIGKSERGLKEPINVIVRANTYGMGREQHVKEVWHKKLQHKHIEIQEREQHFRAALVEQSISGMLRKDFYKAQRVCEELDFRQNVTLPKDDYFWSKETISKLKAANSSKTKDDDEDSVTDDAADNYEECITEEHIFGIIKYLRENYFYCLYCGFAAIDYDDLKQNCPGPYRVDHDSEDL